MLLSTEKNFNNIHAALTHYGKNKTSCVYKLFAENFSDYYIGMSTNINKRFKWHINNLTYGFRNQIELYHFLSEVGINNIQVSILYEEEMAEKRWQKLFEKLRMIESIFVENDFRKGYRLKNNRNYHKKTMLEFSSTSIIQLDSKGDFEKRHTNIYSLIDAYEVGSVNILQCCNSLRTSYLEKRWRYSKK